MSLLHIHLAIVNRGSSEGPSFSSMQATYAGQPFMTEGYFSQGNNLGYQLWTVPGSDGTYRITAGGARGGRDTNYGIADIWGASMRGDFDLLAGDTIEMCIGSGGNQYGSPHGNEAGGGGGTFVRNNTTGSVMIVAGGGGGSAGNVYGNSCTRNITNAYGQTSDTAAQTTCQGNYTVNSSTSGQGGTGAGQYWGGGGGGYVGDGASGYTHCSAPVGGKSFGNGAVGGNGNHCYTPSGQGNRGGFGGGGGGNLSGPGGGEEVTLEEILLDTGLLIVNMVVVQDLSIMVKTKSTLEVETLVVQVDTLALDMLPFSSYKF